MRPAAVPFLAALCLPLAAQAPTDRRDAASIGLGYGSQGPMLTYMRTGPLLGCFGGFSYLSGGSSALEEAGSGTPHWVRNDAGASEWHLGAAFRVDNRWVLGAGIGQAVNDYQYTYNPGSTPFPASPIPSSGPVSERRFGPVAMVDLRLGDNWGVEATGGAIGAGLTITHRF